jgi:hypothetical protein
MAGDTSPCRRYPTGRSLPRSGSEEVARLCGTPYPIPPQRRSKRSVAPRLNQKSTGPGISRSLALDAQSASDWLRPCPTPWSPDPWPREQYPRPTDLRAERCGGVCAVALGETPRRSCGPTCAFLVSWQRPLNPGWATIVVIISRPSCPRQRFCGICRCNYWCRELSASACAPSRLPARSAGLTALRRGRRGDRRRAGGFGGGRTDKP